jgi:UDP-glucose 4-epimerase
MNPPSETQRSNTQESDNATPGAVRPARCLVTGGAGFIGSHAVRGLIDSGNEVAVLDNLSTGKQDNLPDRVPLFTLDITDDVSTAFSEFRPDVLVHLAAQTSVPASVANPGHDARTNILGSIEMIRACAEHGVKKIVYASSAAAYGPVDALPLDENLRPQPVSPYGASKYTVEHYLRSAAKESGLEWAALRFANVYGPRQDPHGEAGVVAIFTGFLLDGETPTIYDDGKQTRDYVYVGDVAGAIVRAVHVDLAGHPDPVFNVSTGTEISVNDLLKEMNAALETDVQPRYAPARAGDVRRSRLDPSRAQEALGWRAEVSIGDGLRRTLEFFRDRV